MEYHLVYLKEGMLHHQIFPKAVQIHYGISASLMQYQHLIGINASNEFEQE